MYLKIIALKKIDSTNDYLRDAAMAGAKEITVVSSRVQTKGRGRRGRKWISPPGGLYASYLFRSAASSQNMHLVGMLLALSLVRAARGIIPLHIKWPNDVCAGNKKIAGILTERHTAADGASFVVAGIGVNINTDDSALPPTATSFYRETGKKSSVRKLFDVLTKEVILLYQLLAKDTAAVVDEIRHNMLTLGKEVTVHINKKRHKGTAYNINNEGALLFKDRHGTNHTLYASNITHVR